MNRYEHKGNRPEIHPTAYIAPGAHIIGNVHIGRESSVWFNTVIRGDFDRISIGERTNIQDLTTCHADEGIPLTIGDGVTIGHRSVIHGCTIEEGCLIGMGAVVMNRAVIGKGAIVAAGAVVLENTVIPPYSLVTGSPARVKKTYQNREQIDRDIKEMSEIYTGNALDFADPSICRKI